MWKCKKIWNYHIFRYFKLHKNLIISIQTFGLKNLLYFLILYTIELEKVEFNWNLKSEILKIIITFFSIKSIFNRFISIFKRFKQKNSKIKSIKKCSSWNSTSDRSLQNSNFLDRFRIIVKNSFFQSTMPWKIMNELSSNSEYVQFMSIKIS